MKLVVTTLLWISSWSLIAQVTNAPYKIIQTKTGNNIGLPELIELLQKAPIVIFGEQHDDSVAHHLQLKVLEGLNSQHNGNLILSMEMWQKDVQPIMNEYLAGFISEKNFKTESRAWNNYKDYKPLIDFAKDNKVEVLCANTPARYTNMVTRKTFNALDVLSTETKKNYLPPFPIDTLEGRYYEKFLEAMGGHVTPDMFIYQSQNLWDATMAHSILTARKQQPKKAILHLNGRFHSDEYLGVTYRIKRAKTKDVVLTISAINEDEYIAGEHKQLADFVIITGKKR